VRREAKPTEYQSLQQYRMGEAPTGNQ
jgi:hypothetical protein